MCESATLPRRRTVRCDEGIVIRRVDGNDSRDSSGPRFASFLVSKSRSTTAFSCCMLEMHGPLNLAMEGLEHQMSSTPIPSMMRGAEPFDEGEMFKR